MKKNTPPKKTSNSDATDVALGLASFAPPPYGTAASAVSFGRNVLQGDYVGASLDALDVVTGQTSKYFRAASQVAKAAGSAKVASKVAKKANALAKLSNPKISKTAGLVRDASSSSVYVNTKSVPQRDNTFVASRVNPYTIKKK